MNNSFGNDASSTQNYGVGGGYRSSLREAGRNGSAGVVVVIEHLGGEEDA